MVSGNLVQERESLARDVRIRTHNRPKLMRDVVDAMAELRKGHGNVLFPSFEARSATWSLGMLRFTWAGDGIRLTCENSIGVFMGVEIWTGEDTVVCASSSVRAIPQQFVSMSHRLGRQKP